MTYINLKEAGIATILTIIVLFLAIAKVDYRISNSERVIGTVIDIEYEGLIEDYPEEIILFKDHTDKQVEVKRLPHFFNPRDIGSKLVLYFDRDNPEEYMVDSFYGLYLWSAIIPTLLIAIGGTILLIKRRKLREWPVTEGKVMGYIYPDANSLHAFIDEDAEDHIKAYIIQYDINGETYINNTPITTVIKPILKDTVVKVHYNLEDYNELMVYTVYNVYGILSIYIILGLIGLVMY